MQHPDEGTIHAWLDDALDADEAAALVSHVAICAACSALVAEARGFIAASSRIIAQLDGVPGDVLPVPAVINDRVSPRDPVTPARSDRLSNGGDPSADNNSIEHESVVRLSDAPSARRATAPRSWRRYAGLAAAVLGITTTLWYARTRLPLRGSPVSATQETTTVTSMPASAATRGGAVTGVGAPTVADAPNASDASNTETKAATGSAAAGVTMAPGPEAPTSAAVAVSAAVASAASPAAPAASSPAAASPAASSPAAASAAAASPAAASAAAASAAAASRIMPPVPTTAPAGERRALARVDAVPPAQSPADPRVRLAAADMMARTEPSASLSGCYRLLALALTDGKALGTAVAGKSARSGLIAASRPAAEPTQWLQLTDSILPAAGTPTGSSSELREGIQRSYLGYTSGFGSTAAPRRSEATAERSDNAAGLRVNANAPVRWSRVASDAVRLQLPDGSSVVVRLAADSSSIAGPLDRETRTAIRSACP